jgi:hypothetical protein
MKETSRLKFKRRRRSGNEETKATGEQHVAATGKPSDLFGFMANKVKIVGDIESRIPAKRSSTQH